MSESTFGASTRNTGSHQHYTKQLATYKIAEQTVSGFYVGVDVGHMGKKDERLIQIKNAAASRGEATSPIIFIDGLRRASASKL